MGSPGVHRRLCGEKEAGDCGASQSGGDDPVWGWDARIEPLARRVRRALRRSPGRQLCRSVSAGGPHVGEGGPLVSCARATYSALDQIDLGIYVTTTKVFQKRMNIDFGQN